MSHISKTLLYAPQETPVLPAVQSLSAGQYHPQG